MTTKLGQNLLSLRKSLDDNVSQDEMAKRLGLSKSTYGSYENGRTEPKLVDLLKMADYFKVTTDKLLGGDVTIHVPAFTKNEIRLLATTVNAENENNIEFVPIKAAAGYVQGFGDLEFIETLPVFQVPFLQKDKKYRVFPIQGDSMLPLKEGSYVFSEYIEDWKNVKSGTVCIIVTREEGIVLKKVFNYLNEKNLLVLKSTNERYAPYAVMGKDIKELWRFAGYFQGEFPS